MPEKRVELPIDSIKPEDFNNSFKEVIDYTTSMLVASKNSNERIFMILNLPITPVFST